MRTYRKFQNTLIDELRANPERAFIYTQAALAEFEQGGDIEHMLLTTCNVAEACKRGGRPEFIC